MFYIKIQNKYNFLSKVYMKINVWKLDNYLIYLIKKQLSSTNRNRSDLSKTLNRI